MQQDQFTLKEQMIDVGDGHQLYTQLWGNADAEQTIIFLHGGPGGGCKDGHKQLFDPTQQRVLFFDQRGSGKSLPYGSLEANDTDALVEDINKLTAAYAIDTFVLTGGSWGSCLALAYGIKYPNRVTRMVLRGIFTGRKAEIEFIDKGGVATFFPEVWDRFTASVPAESADDPAAYHQARLFGADTAASLKAAMAYADLEGSISSLDDRSALPEMVDPETFDPISTLVESHYLVHQCFLPEGFIIANAGTLTMRIDLVQGRYDMVCPPFTAYELHKALPNSQLHWTIAGHSGNDRVNFELVKALLV